MPVTLKSKKIIAKEILLFFFLIGLLVILWACLTLRNIYYDKKTTSLKNQLNSISSKLESIPVDEIKSLYEDGIVDNFIIKYKLSKKDKNYVSSINYQQQEKTNLTNTHFVYKKEESEFIKKHPSAKIIPINSKGYFFDHFIDRKDSLMVFEYLDLNKFRELMKNKNYWTNLYETFAADKEPPIGQIEYAKKYKLGTRSEFEKKVQEGIKYDKDIDDKRTAFINQKQTIEESIKRARIQICSMNEIKSFMITAVFVLGIILYPLRLIYFIIKWSINTVKNKEKY